MGSFSLWHWLIVLIAAAVIIYPVTVILRKAGRSPWWAILAIIPWVNVVALWVFALTAWPKQDR